MMSQPQEGKRCLVSLLTEIVVKSSKGPFLLVQALQGAFDPEGVFVAEAVVDIEGERHNMPAPIMLWVNLTTVSAIQLLTEKPK